MGNRAGARLVVTGETPFGYPEKASFAGLTNDYGLGEYFRAIGERPDIVEAIAGLSADNVDKFQGLVLAVFNAKKAGETDLKKVAEKWFIEQGFLNQEKPQPEEIM